MPTSERLSPKTYTPLNCADSAAGAARPAKSEKTRAGRMRFLVLMVSPLDFVRRIFAHKGRGTRCEVRGARCEVRGARSEVRGSRFKVRAKPICLAPRTSYLVPRFNTP